MTRKDKLLLLKDISARLPYGVKYQDRIEGGIHILSLGIIHHYERFVPYLRPMSSMTEKEKVKFGKYCVIDILAWEGDTEIGFKNQADIMADGIDWLLARHFDFRGLIEKGLALEAPEDMYK